MNANTGIIDIVQYQRIENEIKQSFFDLVETTKNISGEFEHIFSNVSGGDLSFLGLSYQNEIKELEKINNKINNYYTILSNVRIGYQNQESEIAQSVNLYLNKLNINKEVND